MKLVYDAPSFSLGLTQEDLVTVVSNPLQLRKSGISKEIRSKFCIDEVKMTEILKRKGLKKTPSPKEQKTKKQLEKKRKSKEIKDKVEKSYDESEEESEEEGMSLAIQVWLYEFCSNVPPKIVLKVENRIPQLLNWKTIAPRPRYEFLMNVMFKDNEKVVFKNIEPTEMEMAKLEIPKKDVTEDERSIDSDDNFQDPLPKKINKHSKKKQKVDSSTPVAKKPAGKKQVNIDDAHTQTRTPPHRVAKVAVMKTPVFKPIPTRQVSSSKTKEEKKTARVIFPQVRSKADSHVEEVAALKRESHVKKEKFISKKVFDAFREEVRQEFKGVREEFTQICQLVKKKFKKMIKAIEHSKQQHEDTEVEAQQVDYAGVETSPQQFSPIVDQNLDENQDGTKITDEKLDDTNFSDSQFTIPNELLPSLNAYRRESTTRHPLVTLEEEQIDEHFNDKKSESVVLEHCQKNKENIGSRAKADMHGEVDVGTEEKIVTTPTTQDLTIDEKRDETVLPNSQDTIPDDLLPTLNVYSSKSIIVHPSANREIQTPIAKLRIRRPSKFKESPYMMKFGSAAESSEGHIRIFPQKHPFVYHPIDGIVDTKIVNKFRDWISEDLLKVYAKRKKSKYDPNRSYKFSTVDCKFMNIISSLHDVYSTDADNLTAGGHMAHVNEHINGFHMHVTVSWHTVKDIYIPVNIKEKYHWVLAILSFSERCIFLYDSYESSGHYSAVLNVIEKLAAIILLCLKHCDFYVKKGIHVENHPRYKDKDSSDMFDVLFQENLPQQPSGSLDCGVYMVTYVECLSYGHKIFATKFDPNALRIRYAATLWDYGTIKQELNAHSDVEAPLRPPRQSRITSVTEVFDHIDVYFYYLRKKSKYGPHSSYKNEPNKSYKYSTIDYNFMDVIRSLNDVYSMDAQNLKDGGQEHHLMEYINGLCMHAAVPWHTVEDIFIPVNIKEKHHWVFAVLSFSERCIFLYDSYESSGHYAVVLAEIEKIAKIIPLCLQACDFYVKKGIDHQSHPRYKDKESSDMFDVLFQDDLPQQPSESLDCGMFMFIYAECLSYRHKVIASEFDPNTLRTRYAVLLWDYGIRKQEANVISDVEAPVRPAKQSRITSVTEVVDV
ncbi:hypothetical protein BC332_02770 [Capsicum chinense]|nr:hypothetical protein BC332_02770 [Capsicum chinense]